MILAISSIRFAETTAFRSRFVERIAARPNVTTGQVAGVSPTSSNVPLPDKPE